MEVLLGGNNNTCLDWLQSWFRGRPVVRVRLNGKEQRQNVSEMDGDS